MPRQAILLLSRAPLARATTPDSSYLAALKIANSLRGRNVPSATIRPKLRPEHEGATGRPLRTYDLPADTTDPVISMSLGAKTHDYAVSEDADELVRIHQSDGAKPAEPMLDAKL